MWYSLSKNSIAEIKGRMPRSNYGGSSSFQVIDGQILPKEKARNIIYTQPRTETASDIESLSGVCGAAHINGVIGNFSWKMN